MNAFIVEVTEGAKLNYQRTKRVDYLHCFELIRLGHRKAQIIDSRGSPTAQYAASVTNMKPDLYNRGLTESLQRGDMKKTLYEIRTQFEKIAKEKMFDLRRAESGEYSSHRTFYLWGGYWSCAVENGVLAGKDADLCNMNDWGKNR